MASPVKTGAYISRCTLCRSSCVETVMMVGEVYKRRNRTTYTFLTQWFTPSNSSISRVHDYLSASKFRKTPIILDPEHQKSWRTTASLCGSRKPLSLTRFVLPSCRPPVRATRTDSLVLVRPYSRSLARWIRRLAGAFIMLLTIVMVGGSKRAACARPAILR